MSRGNAARDAADRPERPLNPTRFGASLVSLGIPWLLGVSALCSAGDAAAAFPTLTGVSPNAFHPGTSVAVKFAGKLDGSGRRVWCDDPAVTFSLPDAGGVSTAVVGPDAAPGLHLVRFVNNEGATLPVRVAVGPLPLFEEKEPNDAVTAPQPVPGLPVWVQGRLEKANDVDSFALPLKKGVTLFCKVDAYTLGSPVDVHLHLLDQRGTRLATSSDGQNLDTELSFTPLEDGVYLLQVAGFGHPPASDINFTGSALCVYQLSLSDAAVVQRVYPAALPAEGKASVESLGQALKQDGTKVELSPVGLPGFADLGTVFPKGAVAPIAVVRARHPIQPPTETSLENPAVFAPPFITGGRLAKPGTLAAYRVTMKKGDRLQARFWSRTIGLGLDGSLTVKNPAGEQVAANPNPADVFQEPSVTWTATADGDYTVVVRDLFQRGGPAAEFVLEIAAPVPGYSIDLADGKPLRIDAGKTLAIKVKATFTNGWKEPLVVRLAGLPEGVFAPEIAVPEKGGDFEIPLQAASNAPAATVAVSASVWTKTTPPTLLGIAFPLRGELRRGVSQSDFARDLWITVAPPGTPPPPPAPAKK
jgi:hypothetical protein